VNLFDVEVQKDDDDAAGYEISYVRVGPQIGAEQLGLSVYELPPGQSICPYHYEFGAEEWLIVLTGTPTLRTPDGSQQLRSWDTVFFPEGPDGAHKVTNETGEMLRVAMLSNRSDPGVAVYPDSDKVGAYPPNKLFKLDDAVDYFEGEAPGGASPS
jgi:uncharacterized cupin superfamily protein